MSGSIIGGLLVKNAAILAYDTRVHKNQVMKTEWSWAVKAYVEKINQKVHLAQYCALAASGRRAFSKYIHGELLKHVTELLRRGEQLMANDAVKFLEKTIQNKVDLATHLEQKEQDAVKKLVKHCGLILGIWETTDDGRKVPKLKRLYRGKILKDANYCACGIQHKVATRVLKDGYRRNMSIQSGVDLLVKAIKAAFEKDGKFILGGYIEVLILGYTNPICLPLSRGEQLLNRATTIFRWEKLRDRDVRRVEVEDEEGNLKKRPRLILAESDEE
ncbi:hypothetical protein MKX03_006241 [Papaver bracteatum]|nr:hypothetical protein MKX03_006241 [Papaver bracteatum]